MIKSKELNKFNKKALPYYFLTPAMLVLVCLMLYPIIQVIIFSFFDNVITNPNPKFVGLSNYKEVLSDDVFHSSVFHTVHFTVFSVIFHMVIGMSFALLLNAKINSTVRPLFRLIMILPWLFTPTVIAIVWKLILDPGGIVNFILSRNTEWFGNPDTSLNALTFANIWAGYSFYLISILAGLQSVSNDQYDAAKIDGVNGLQNFWYITLPHLKPVLLSLTMLDLIWTMQVFPLIWILTGGGPGHTTEVMSTYTYKQTFFNFEFSIASTAAVVILVISLVMAFFYARMQNKGDLS